MSIAARCTCDRRGSGFGEDAGYCPRHKVRSPLMTTPLAGQNPPDLTLKPTEPREPPMPEDQADQLPELPPGQNLQPPLTPDEIAEQEAIAAWVRSRIAAGIPYGSAQQVRLESAFHHKVQLRQINDAYATTIRKST